jgi:type IV pilus assembly protein PilE
MIYAMKRPGNSKHRLKAFTLTEVLVVLIIIGILILLALPNLMPLITKAKATEAKLQLQHVYTLEKSYFYERSHYSKDLPEISFEQQKLTTQGGQANYRIEIIEAGNNRFRARATSVVDFNGDGNFNVWEIDQDKNLIETAPD